MFTKRAHLLSILLCFTLLLVPALACNLTAPPPSTATITPATTPAATATPTVVSLTPAPAAMATPMVAPMVAPALPQDGGLSWASAPVVPVRRSDADWRIDMGWTTTDALFSAVPRRTYAEGDTETFSYSPDHQITAELRAIGQHAYWWMEVGAAYAPDRLAYAVRRFDEDIYPLNRAIFGSEWSPGIDGDPRVHILHMENLGIDAVGIFDPYDQCPRALCPESNEREIMYIGLDWGPVGSDQHLTTIAHEFQHLIGYHVDGNDFRWVQEGLSQVAEHLNGFDPWYIAGDGVREYLSDTDFSLTDWPYDDEKKADVAYAAAYLFTLYLYERFGPDFIRALSQEPADGMAGVQAALERLGVAQSADEVFADWIVANVLDDPLVGDGRYHYQSYELSRRPWAESDPGGVWRGAASIQQYGADYLRITAPGAYTFTFDGADAAPLIEATPLVETTRASGAWVWWGYWNDHGAARLTARFDLSGLDRATLQYRVWHDIEPDFDWAYVEASTDGRRWDILEAGRMKPQNDLTAGPHYTGRSGGWVRDAVDLSAYAGGPVYVRFEYLTDGSVTGPGILIDDLAIPELGYGDDVETPGGVWQAEGFVRVTGQVRQRWAVAIIDLRRDGPPTVRLLPLDANNKGQASLNVDAGSEGVIVAVGAMAPFTRQPTEYAYRITPK